MADGAEHLQNIESLGAEEMEIQCIVLCLLCCVCCVVFVVLCLLCCVCCVVFVVRPSVSTVFFDEELCGLF